MFSLLLQYVYMEFILIFQSHYGAHYELRR